MQCPIDQETLMLSERQGIEIDYCPRCRGVWLDRGELDKLIAGEADRYELGPDRGDHSRERDDDDDRRRMQGPKRKKKGFLSEMFEFGD